MPQIIRVVNWHLYQHYKDRNPPWIKVYTRLIDGDSREFLRLKDEEKWHFVAIMMLASRQQNAIPNDPEWIEQRLRFRKPLNLAALEATGMIEIVDVASTSLAPREHIARPETETETEKRQIPRIEDAASEDGFAAWYRLYPRRVGRIPASKAWGKLSKEDRESAMAAVGGFSASWAVRPQTDIQFCPHPATWLNGRRWEDDAVPVLEDKPKPKELSPEFVASEKAERADLLRRIREGIDA